jgi:hypothetical protein
MSKDTIDWNEEKSSDLNWMITCEEGVEHRFRLEKMTVERTEITVGKHEIDTYLAHMRDIIKFTGRKKHGNDQTEDVEEDGWYDIPFWAKKSFIDMMKSASNVEWLTVAYWREKDSKDLNKGIFEEV